MHMILRSVLLLCVGGLLAWASPGLAAGTTLFSGLFGGEVRQMTLSATQVLERKLSRRKPEFAPQEVKFSGYPAGTIVIDTGVRYLYLVESRSTARRYAIGVGEEGLEFKGRAKVGDKQE